MLFNGYLTEAINGPAIDATNFASVLLQDEYYFHVPHPDDSRERPDPHYKYPVVPTFHHWRFPHNRLPLIWQSLQTTAPNYPMAAPSNIGIYLRLHDGNLCRVTRYGDAVNKAHIVPDMERQWFDWNYMRRYITQPSPRRGGDIARHSEFDFPTERCPDLGICSKVCRRFRTLLHLLAWSLTS